MGKQIVEPLRRQVARGLCRCCLQPFFQMHAGDEIGGEHTRAAALGNHCGHAHRTIAEALLKPDRIGSFLPIIDFLAQAGMDFRERLQGQPGVGHAAGELPHQRNIAIDGDMDAGILNLDCDATAVMQLPACT